MSLIAPTLEAFFTERLMMQKNASPHTVASYRDCHSFAPSGNWGSGSLAFAISRGSSRRTVPYAWTRPPVSWHAIFP